MPESFNPAALLAELKADPTLADDPSRTGPPMSADIDELEAMAETPELQQAEKAEADARRLRPDRERIAARKRTPTREWTDELPPARPYLLDWQDDDGQRHGLFPRGKVGLLAAPGGTGKSFALIDLAIAVATGTEWLGAFPVNARNGGGRVFLAMAEEDEDEMRRRLWATMRARSLSAAQRAQIRDRVTVLPLAGVPCALTGTQDGDVNDFRTTFADALEAELRDDVKDDPDGWGLILLDPVSRFAGDDAEKDNAAATRFVQALEGMVNLPGSPSVLAAVHTNKGAKDGGYQNTTDSSLVRGSSAFVDGARWVAGMALAKAVDGVSSTERVWIGVSKSNYGPRPSRPELLYRSEGGALVVLPPDIARAAMEEEQQAGGGNGNGSGMSREDRESRRVTSMVNAAVNALNAARQIVQRPEKLLTALARASSVPEMDDTIVNDLYAKFKASIDPAISKADELLPALDALKEAVEALEPVAIREKASQGRRSRQHTTSVDPDFG